MRRLIVDAQPIAISRHKQQQPSRWKVVTLVALFVIVAALVCVSHGTFREKVPLVTVEKVDKSFHEAVEELPEYIIRTLDAILVLGGGAPKSLEYPPLYTKERCDDAAQVVKERRTLDHHLGLLQRIKAKPGIHESTQDLPILCLSAGTAHVPQLMGQDGLPVWESTSSVAYLQEEYNLSNLYVETTSYDTIGNAFYARTTHTDINEWRNLLIITSEFHMERTKAIFDWIFLSVEPKLGYQLTYLASQNSGLTDKDIRARKKKERESLQLVQKYATSQRTMKDVYWFLTHDHALYTAKKLVERAKADSSEEKEMALFAKSYGGGRR